MKRTICLYLFPSALALSLLGLGLAARPAAARDHVRVILDVSGSMKTNDPGRLVILATLLLHDLARPNTTLGDSFEVIPFDTDWNWQKPSDPPPVSSRPTFRAEWGKRQQFVDALYRQDYDSKMTYFYPGLRRAIDDLKNTPGGGYDVRVIVLVTDGVPEPPTRDREAELIRQDLVPLLKEHNIRLYVLGFSQEAKNNQSYFDAMVEMDGFDLGQVYVDPDGSRLPANMLRIFGRSFGFTPDAALNLPGVTELNLEASTTPERVAVVVSTPRPEAPTLELTPPLTGTLNFLDELKTAGRPGASYAVQWVLAPDPGQYGFDTDVLDGSVAVLRPSRLELEIRPAPPHIQCEKTMAETPFKVGILVKSAAGAKGDPGAVEIKFQPLGERLVDPETGVPDYSWKGEISSPPAGPGTVVAEGRLYEGTVKFAETPGAPHEVYAGYLEVHAKRGEAVVATLRALTAHRIEVHPLLSIVPTPLSSHVSKTALGRQEKACIRFSLELNAGLLPHPDKPEYSLRVVLEPPAAEVLDNELHEATFTLDGRPLEFEQRPGQDPGEWYVGRVLGADEMLGEHEVCITVGKPTRGDPATPLDLALRFTLLETPYDDFRVARDFTLRALIAPPSFLEKWRSFLLVGLGLLALLAALWYLRNRPSFPPDLRYAIGREGGAGMSSLPLPEGSLVARALGRVVERPVTGAGEDHTLAWVRPTDEELYRLRPARKVRVEALTAEEKIPFHRKLATLSVHRTYRLVSDRGSYLFRMEYR